LLPKRHKRPGQSVPGAVDWAKKNLIDTKMAKMGKGGANPMQGLMPLGMR